MKRISQTLLMLSVLTLAGCVSGPAPANNAPPTNAGANTSAPAATPAAAASPAADGRAASNLPVTLPVLDAMFADEAFAGELKSRLQLTDEQVGRLRQVAREETGNLQEGEGEHSGTTTEATRRASAKVEEVLGRDKARDFNAFVRERWGGGDAAQTPARPNSVPTDTRVVVNAPAYRMDVFEGGKLVKTYKIGIGYPEFPLPQGTRKADQIIFNPVWTPPDEPWVKGKFAPGRKVEAGSKDNPLGLIKIPIGQPSLIHGGKSPARLGSFASHGCVGLTNPQVQDFAVVLAKIGGADVTPEIVKAHAQKRDETKNVRLSNAVPVELRYETIVVEDGRLHIYRDVYDKGTNTEENLRRVLEAFGVRLEDLSEQERAQVTEALKAMARDAQGNPADGQPAPTPTPGKNKNANANVRETKTVKGQKQIVIDIAALRGKGYPAPVNLDAGGAPATQPKAAAAKKRA